MNEYEHLIYLIHKYSSGDKKATNKNTTAHKYFFDSKPEQIFADEVKRLINTDKQNKYEIVLGRNYLVDQTLSLNINMKTMASIKKQIVFQIF